MCVFRAARWDILLLELKSGHLPLVARLVPLGRANDLFRVEFADQFVQNLLQQPILARLRPNVGEEILALRLKLARQIADLLLGLPRALRLLFEFGRQLVAQRGEFLLNLLRVCARV